MKIAFFMTSSSSMPWLNSSAITLLIVLSSSYLTIMTQPNNSSWSSDNWSIQNLQLRAFMTSLSPKSARKLVPTCSPPSILKTKFSQNKSKILQLKTLTEPKKIACVIFLTISTNTWRSHRNTFRKKNHSKSFIESCSSTRSKLLSLFTASKRNLISKLWELSSHSWVSNSSSIQKWYSKLEPTFLSWCYSEWKTTSK